MILQFLGIILRLNGARRRFTFPVSIQEDPTKLYDMASVAVWLFSVILWPIFLIFKVSTLEDSVQKIFSLAKSSGHKLSYYKVSLPYLFYNKPFKTHVHKGRNQCPIRPSFHVLMNAVTLKNFYLCFQNVLSTFQSTLKTSLQVIKRSQGP
jgi:hypothetical protein